MVHRGVAVSARRRGGGGLSCHGKALPLLADVEKAGMRAAARAK